MLQPSPVSPTYLMFTEIKHVLNGYDCVQRCSLSTFSEERKNWLYLVIQPCIFIDRCAFFLSQSSHTL